jgi:hypothetical protein
MNPTGIFLDLTQAYDVLNHPTLLSKLNSYGIRGVVNLWFESYVCHRKLCVEINTMKIWKYASTVRGLEHGMLQGSVLSPVPFLLYVGDLPVNIMSSKRVLFADDTNILLSGKNMSNLQCKINKVMTELQMWFKLNNLVVNSEKTMAVPFHTLQNKRAVLPHIKFYGRDIRYNTGTKFLGIYIDENLKWNSHIKY